jgi:hypothetical protein
MAEEPQNSPLPANPTRAQSEAQAYKAFVRVGIALTLISVALWMGIWRWFG